MKSFAKDFSIQVSDDTTMFEHFANYCSICRHCSDAYQEDPTFYEDVHTGAGGDYGVDGVLFLINDQPVTSIEQLEEIKSKKWSVKLLFIQAKTSDQFDSGDMLKTGNGVVQVLKFDKSRANDHMANQIKILEAIYEKSDCFSSIPQCFIYFVTTGIWKGDANLIQVKEKIESDVNALNLTSPAEFIPIDRDRLHRMYRDITQSITKTIEMVKSVSFPSIDGIREAYVGLIGLPSLLKLITDDDGMIQNNLFYENVRGFLGYNPVNAEIKRTLESPDKAVHFPILNNGVTIIAKSLSHIGDKYTISDFQIVNGCQTCNVIYDCRAKLSEQDYCTLKLICTDNTDVITDVIKSTNKQSQVLDEAFESLKLIHKKIQSYFDAVDSDYRLYYERRAKEFDNTTEVNRHKVVTLTTLINAFLSFALYEPQSTHRYYGELLRANKDRLFKDDDQPVLYYTAAWCLYKVDQALSLSTSTVRKYRYHIIMILANIAAQRPNPFRPNSKEVEKYCKSVCEVVNDEKQFKKMLAKACDLLSKAIQQTSSILGTSNRNELIRRKELTHTILDLIRNYGG